MNESTERPEDAFLRAVQQAVSEKDPPDHAVVMYITEIGKGEKHIKYAKHYISENMSLSDLESWAEGLASLCRNAQEDNDD